MGLLQGHLAGRPLALSRGPFTFPCGICTGCRGYKPQASRLETGEAAEKPNLASEIRPVDERRGSTEPTRHQDPVISDQAGRVPLRLPTLPHLLRLHTPNTSHTQSLG